MFKEICLKSETSAALKSEMLFEIASERVSGTEIIRFNIYNRGNDSVFLRLTTAAKKHVRSFKSRGFIQFFATGESFLSNETEAKFLLNKYPELFKENALESEKGFFLYIKL